MVPEEVESIIIIHCTPYTGILPCASTNLHLYRSGITIEFTILKNADQGMGEKSKHSSRATSKTGSSE